MARDVPTPPHSGWRFQFASDGCPIFHDPATDLYHTVVDVADPTALYQEEFYEAGTAARFFSPIEVVVRLFRRWRAARIAKYIRPGGGALDIGCGNGYVLYYLRENHGVPVVIGTQVSRTAQEFARDHLNVTVKLGSLPDLALDLPKFSLITAWHVFEHVAEYERYFQTVRELLTPDGTFILEVPNARSWSAALSRGGWMGWDPPHHVVHFTPAGLDKLLAENGFQVVFRSTFSLEYSTFTSVQSLCNCLAATRNAFYDGLRRVGGVKPMWGLVAFQALLFALLVPPVLLLNVLLSRTPWGEVLHVVAKPAASR